MIVTDSYGRKYFFKAYNNYCYIGSNGKGNEWNLSEEDFKNVIDSEKPLIYCSGDDMLIKIVQKDDATGN